MLKVMFVCTGNSCRSAMAHALLRRRADERNNKDIRAYSCGIFADDGEYPTSNATEIMKEEYDIDLTKHRAVNINNSRIREMDLVLCAKNAHKFTVLKMFPELEGKVFTIKEYTENNPQDLDIDDPWGYDKEVYRAVAKELDNCIQKLLDKIEK